MHPLLRGEGPLYQRLANGLREAIQAGSYQPGQRLPGVRELNRMLGISVNTINMAVSQLEAEGWLEVRPQAGVFAKGRLEAAGCPGEPTAVRRSDLTMRMLREANSATLTRLGATIPNPDLLPTRMLRAKMHRIGKDGWPNRYEFPPGSEALRQQLAPLALHAGISASPAEIVLCNGCQEAVVGSLLTLCREGDLVAVESPSFHGYLEALELLRLHIVEIPSDPQSGLHMEALQRALREYPVKCVLATPNFSNPNGSLMSDGDKRAMVEVLGDIPLIENDIQGDLSFEEPRPVAAKAFDRAGNVIYCSSFSKTLGPEWRCGWLIAGRHQAAIERTLTYLSFGGNSLVRQALADFLCEGRYRPSLKRARQVYARQAALTVEALRQLPRGSRVSLPRGGKMVWVELPAGVDGVQLAERSRQEGISITPGIIYSVREAYRNCLRINHSYWGPQVEKGLQRLCQLAREL